MLNLAKSELLTADTAQYISQHAAAPDRKLARLLNRLSENVKKVSRNGGYYADVTSLEPKEVVQRAKRILEDKSYIVKIIEYKSCARIQVWWNLDDQS